VKPREKISFGVAISAYRPFRPFSKFNFSRRNDDKIHSIHPEINPKRFF
jgi:hypothetical protein